MADEDRHDRVLDGLLDLQAKLRGDDVSRRLATVRPKQPPAEPSEDRSLQLAPEPVSVRHDDLVVEERPADPGADRLAALSDRLRRVERELATAMERLREAEARYVPGEGDGSEALPSEPERNVYQRVQELQDIASHRQSRRRR